MSPTGRFLELLRRQKGNLDQKQLKQLENILWPNKSKNINVFVRTYSKYSQIQHITHPCYDFKLQAQYIHQFPRLTSQNRDLKQYGWQTSNPTLKFQRFWAAQSTGQNWIQVPKFPNIFSIFWKNEKLPLQKQQQLQEQQQQQEPQKNQKNEKILKNEPSPEEFVESEIFINNSFQITEDQIQKMEKDEFMQTMQNMLDNGVSLSKKLRGVLLEKFMTHLLDLSPSQITLGMKCAVNLPLELNLLMHEQISGVIYLGIGEYSKQDRIDLITCFAYLNLKNDQLLDVIGKWLAHEVKQIDPNILCQILECYEKLGYYNHKTLRDAIVEISAIKISELTPESIAKLMTTLAKFNQSDTLIDVFLDTTAIDILKRLDAFNARHLVDLIWGFAKLHDRGESYRFLITKIVKKLMTTTGEIAPQFLPKLIWGLSRVDKDPNERHTFLEIYGVISYRTIRLMNQFSKDEVLDLAEGFMGVRFLNKDFLKSFQIRCQQLQDTLDVNDIAKIFDVFAFFVYQPNNEFLEWALNEIREKNSEMNVNSVCTILWALSFFEKLPTDVYQKLFKQLNFVDYGLNLGPVALQKLFKANALIKTQQNKQDLIPLPENFQRLTEQAWEDRLYRSYHISRTELEIMDILRDMGIQVEVEKIINKILMVDLEIFVPGKGKAVVEIDGPRRFTVNQPYVPLGDTIWSRRLLKEFGFRVIVICTYEWKQLEDQREKQQKIRELIRSL